MNEKQMKLREIDALVAYHFFGWRWFARANQFLNNIQMCALFPPRESGPWVRWNFYDDFEEIAIWPTPHERFVGWDLAGSPDEGNPLYTSRGASWLPHYSTDYNAAKVLVRKLVERGVVFDMFVDQLAILAGGDEIGLYLKRDDLPELICVAALLKEGVTI